MVTRSFANQQALFAPEALAGVAETMGFKAWGAIKLMPSWDGNAEPFKGGSSKFATTGNPVDESSAIDVDITPDFNHLGYVAASRLCLPQTTTPGGGTLSRQHVFEPNPDRPDSKRTYTILYGDSWQAMTIAYALFDSMGLDIQRGQVAFSSAMIARAGEFGSTVLPTNEKQSLTKSGAPTTGSYTIKLPPEMGGETTAAITLAANAAAIKSALVLLNAVDVDDVIVTGGPISTTPVQLEFTGAWGQQSLGLVVVADTFDTGDVVVAQVTDGAGPTYVEEVPIPSIAWDFFADDSWATLGTTQLLACYRGNVDFQSKFDKDSPIDSTIKSFKTLLEKEDQSHPVELVVGVDATAVALIDSFKQGKKKFIRARVTGPLIEGSIYYSITLDFCFLILGRGKIGAAPNSPAVTIPLSGEISRDRTSGKAVRLTIINTVTSY